MKISFPELSLVLLIGPSGSGKSTFARKHFQSTEILNSDYFRGIVSDDENDQSASKDAFDVLNFIATKRLANGKLTVIDATNVQPAARKPLVALAKKHHFFTVAIVLDTPEKVCWERNQGRSDRDFGRHVIRNQSKQMHRSLKHLKREGLRYIYKLTSQEEVESAKIELRPLWNNLKHEHGPFDIIGDVHGCCDELEILLSKLGYERNQDNPKSGPLYGHPEGRKAIFLGDLVDRGPRILDTYQLVRNMVETGSALCVPGNHDMKLVRKLEGRNVQIKYGLSTTLDEIAALPDEFQDQYKLEMLTFLKSLISHYVLDDGNLIVAHAGMKESMQGRGSAKVRDFALYGETTGETDEFGLPVRYNWASEYRGKATVVYGHTPVPEPEWFNRTINIDTGCVFGGKLSALRYPEKDIVSVPAQATYEEPVRPLNHRSEISTIQQRDDDLLRLEDIAGKRVIATRLRGNITIREENTFAALEVISRFAINPKWLIYLPPTMSPSAASTETGYLETLDKAFDYYQKRGISKVICEQKHMGSRAVVIVCQNKEAAQKRFGVNEEGIGVCYTRTGRRFFTDHDLEAKFLERVQKAVTKMNWWEKFETEWICLDCEIMPWSVKAQELLRLQYAAVGAASQAGLTETVRLLEKAAKQTEDAGPVLDWYRERKDMAEKYTAAYRQYCWPVNDLNDLKLAPFHILATESKVHTDKDHIWHMENLTALSESSNSLLHATPYQVVDFNQPVSIDAAVQWWHELTNEGYEGIVVKPMDFIATGNKGLVQPAVKSRGREYLRIIYGPEYTAPGNLERLRQRNISRKQSMALREFSLGIEALQRFVTHEPLYRIHECVFGVLALESEPMDPRL